MKKQEKHDSQNVKEGNSRMEFRLGQMSCQRAAKLLETVDPLP